MDDMSSFDMNPVQLEDLMVYYRLHQDKIPKYSLTHMNGRTIRWNDFSNEEKGTYWLRIGIEYSNAFTLVDEIHNLLSSGYRKGHRILQYSNNVKELINSIGVRLDKLMYLYYSKNNENGYPEYVANIPELSPYDLNCSIGLTFCNLYSYMSHRMSQSSLEFYFQGHLPNSPKRFIRGELRKVDLNYVLKYIHRIVQVLECIDNLVQDPSVLLMFMDDYSVCKASKSSRKIRRNISRLTNDLECIKTHLIEQEKYYSVQQHMKYMNEKVFEELIEVVLHPDNMKLMAKTGVYSDIHKEWRYG